MIRWQKKAVKAASQVTLANRLSFQKEEIIGVKRYRQQRFDEAIDYQAIALASTTIESSC